MAGDEGIPGLANKLNHLFLTVAAPTRSGLYSNDSAAAALAERGITVTGTHLSHLRTGRRDNPSARLLSGLAELFGVPIGYFFDPTVEAQLNSELEALDALRDSDVRGLMMRAHGISPKGIEHLKDILETIRKIEGLDQRDAPRASGDVPGSAPRVHTSYLIPASGSVDGSAGPTPTATRSTTSDRAPNHAPGHTPMA